MKRMISLLLALAMLGAAAFVLSACGGREAPTEAPTTQPTVPTAQEETLATEPEATFIQGANEAPQIPFPDELPETTTEATAPQTGSQTEATRPTSDLGIVLDPDELPPIPFG